MNSILVTHLLDQYPVQGWDMSKWQDDPTTDFIFDPTILIRGGMRFAFVRWGQGLVKDKRFDVFWKILKETTVEKNGQILRIDRSPYLFPDYSQCLKNSDKGNAKIAISQSAAFWDSIKSDPGELPSMFDLENNKYWYLISWSNSKRTMRYMYALINDYAMRSGCLPVIYWNNWIPFSIPEMRNFDNFFAWWNDKYVSKKILDDRCKKYKLKRGWKFWQHCSDGDSDGNGTSDGLELGFDVKTVDLDVFNGTEEEYSIYCGQTPAPILPSEEDEVCETETNTILELKYTTGYLNVRSSTKTGTAENILFVLPPLAKVECVEKIVIGAATWWRIGQDQYCVEKYNGYTYLK